MKEVGIVRIIVFLLHIKSEWSDRASARKDEGLRAAMVERDNLWGHELIGLRANSWYSVFSACSDSKKYGTGYPEFYASMNEAMERIKLHVSNEL